MSSEKVGSHGGHLSRVTKERHARPHVHELRELARALKQHLDASGAAWLGLSTSSPAMSEPYDQAIAPLYVGLPMNVATLHYARGYRDDGWLPVQQPWLVRNRFASLAKSHNEPIGPGSSVASETDPMRIAMAVVVNILSGGAAYVYHTDAGIWSQPIKEEWPENHRNGREIPRAIVTAVSLFPGDAAAWTRFAQQPFESHGGSNRGLYTIARGGQFYSAVIGATGTQRLSVSFDAHLTVFHPTTAEVLVDRDVAAGEIVELDGLSSYIIKGAADIDVEHRHDAGTSWSTEQWREYFFSLSLGPVASTEALRRLEPQLEARGATLQRNSAGELRGRLYLPTYNPANPWSRAVDVVTAWGGPWTWIP
jgi:hypothetical protein